MKIIFFFRAITHTRSSIERLFHGLINALPMGIICREKFAPTYRVRPFSILTNLIWAWFYKTKCGVNHITGDIHYIALLLPRKNTVLTVHDTGNLDNWPNKKLMSFRWWFWFEMPMKRARKVVAISEFTRNRLVERYPWVERKISIIGNYYDPQFVFCPRDFNEAKPVILVIGTKSNKNVERLFEAVSGICCHVRIIGPLTDKQEELLRENHVEFSSELNISNQQLIEEYRASDIVYFASKYEGFGLISLEAQATGRALITSDIEPMRSIVLDSAIKVDPESTEEIREAVLQIKSDKLLRDQLIEKGQNNIKRFSLESVVRQYENIYKECSC